MRLARSRRSKASACAGTKIDHLIPRSIGGADEEANLWRAADGDKSRQTDGGANKKERLEKSLNQDVCKKRSPELLAEYQQKIRMDWRGLYREIYGDKGRVRRGEAHPTRLACGSHPPPAGEG